MEDTKDIDTNLQTAIKAIKREISCADSMHSIKIRIEADTNSIGFVIILSTKINGTLIESSPHLIARTALTDLLLKIETHIGFNPQKELLGMKRKRMDKILHFLKSSKVGCLIKKLVTGPSL